MRGYGGIEPPFLRDQVSHSESCLNVGRGCVADFPKQADAHGPKIKLVVDAVWRGDEWDLEERSRKGRAGSRLEASL
jgi:hypothetical protein